MHISRAEPTYLLKFEDVSVVGVTSTGLQVGKGFETVNGSLLSFQTGGEPDPQIVKIVCHSVHGMIHTRH